MNGFIKLHRQIVEWGWYKEPNTKALFLHLLLTATFKNAEYKGYKLKPGDVVVGRKALAKTLGMSEQQIRTSLKHLESTGEITKKTTNKFTIVSIVKWESYQIEDVELTNNQPTTNQQLTNNQPHLKNVKKEKNDNNVKNIDIDRSGPQLFSREGRDLSGEPKTVYETYSDAQGYLEEMRKRMREKGMA